MITEKQFFFRPYFSHLHGHHYICMFPKLQKFSYDWIEKWFKQATKSIIYFQKYPQTWNLEIRSKWHFNICYYSSVRRLTDKASGLMSPCNDMIIWAASMPVPVISRPWLVVWSGFKPATSYASHWCSSNWAQQAALTVAYEFLTTVWCLGGAACRGDSCIDDQNSVFHRQTYHH